MITYVVTNKLNGKQYVGQTTRTMERRWDLHCYKGNALHKAIVKYGKENFSYRTLSECKTIEQLNDAEAYWIDHLQTLAPNGYNLTTGGDGYTRTEENRKALSLSHIGVNAGKDHPMYGKHHSEETKALLSEIHKGNSYAKGYKHTDEAKKAMSEKKKGRVPWNKGLKKGSV